MREFLLTPLLLALHPFTRFAMRVTPSAGFTLGVNLNRIAEVFDYSPVTLSVILFLWTIYKTDQRWVPATGIILHIMSFVNIHNVGKLPMYLTVLPLSVCVPLLLIKDNKNAWLYYTVVFLLVLPGVLL